MIRFPDSPAWCFLAKIAGEVKLQSFWVSHGDTLFLAIYWYVVPDMTLWYTMCPFWSFLFLIFGILNLMIVCMPKFNDDDYKSMEVSLYIIFRLSFSSWWCWICMHDSRFFLIFKSPHYSVIYMTVGRARNTPQWAQEVWLHLLLFRKQRWVLRERGWKTATFNSPSVTRAVYGKTRWVLRWRKENWNWNAWGFGVCILATFQNLKPEIYCM